jgi:hypothetical protein
MIRREVELLRGRIEASGQSGCERRRTRSPILDGIGLNEDRRCVVFAVAMDERLETGG